MKKFVPLFVLTSLFTLFSCASTTPLDTALNKYFNGELPQYKLAMSDLNYDGLDEAVLYLNDKNWCGTGGCTLLIFKNTGEKFEFFSKTTLVRPSIKYSNSSNSIWKTLIVQTKGVGEVALHYNGKSYPLNPSTLPPINVIDKDHAITLIKQDKY